MSRWTAALIGILLTAVVVIVWFVPARAETITGTVIDLSCYARNRANTRTDHDQGRECAQACIKYEGQPAGLLTTDGKVYQIGGALAANNNAKIAAHVGHMVTITGDVTNKDGMPVVAASDVTMAGK